MDNIINFIRSSKRELESEGENEEPESEGEYEESESEGKYIYEEPESAGNAFTAITDQIQMVRCMHTYLCVMPGFSQKKVTLKELNDLCSTRLSGQVILNTIF
jgi:hypothetical protein